MFYNLGLAGGRCAASAPSSSRPRSRRACATCCSPARSRKSSRDAEKGKRRVYDAVVVDSPPTGRIARFLDVTKAVSDFAKGGPVHSQAEGVVKLLHSEQTAIHLVTLLEALPMQETLEAIDELTELGLPIGSVIVNRNIPAYLGPTIWPRPPRATSTPTPCGRAGAKAGIKLSDNDFAGLLTEAIQHATRIARRAESAEELDEIEVPRLELPALPPTASTSAACTSSPKRLNNKGSDELHTAGPGHALDPGGHLQPRRGVLRRRRCRQDHHRRGNGVARRGIRPHRRRADHRPGQSARPGAGHQDLGNTPQRVPLAPEVTGELHAMMLDMRRTFDEMVVQYSDPERAQAILDNQFYQTVATSLAGTQEYMAMEKLGQLLAKTSGIWSWWTPRRHATRWTSWTPQNGWAASWTAGCGGCCWPWSGHRAAGHRRVGLAMKALSTVLGSQMLSDAAAFVQIAGCHLRRVPGEGRPHIRTAQAAGHPVRGGVGCRARRAARGVVLHRPALSRSTCRWPD